MLIFYYIEHQQKTIRAFGVNETHILVVFKHTQKKKLGVKYFMG